MHTDQYHFMRLQTAIQTKNEGPQEFADLCRALAQKVMCKDSDPVAQRIHHENAEWMLLASFVAGLSGVAGLKFDIRTPRLCNMFYPLRSQSERRKSRKDLARLFTRSLTSQSASNPGRPVDWTVRGIALGTQLTHAQVIT